LAIDSQKTPTSNGSAIHLLLSLQKAGNFLMINQSSVGLPLAQLRFENKKSKLSGDEWGLEVLQPGQCVTVLKQEPHPAPPTGVPCEIVGKLLTNGGPNKFLDSQFDVFFQNVNVASCNMENNASCDVQFSLSP
jgi:hypothetical protein